MPTAAKSRCTRKCGQFATKDGRCDDHQKKPWETPSANTRQLTRGQRAKFRREQLAREPQCRVCGTTTQLEADHITEIEDGGDWQDPSNGQTLCKEHHDEKSLLMKRIRRQRRAAAGG